MNIKEFDEIIIEEIIDEVLNKCKIQHNGCKNCENDCLWRDDQLYKLYKSIK